MPLPLSTMNVLFVGASGDHVVIAGFPDRPVLPKSLALNLAAWLVALADDDDQFDELLERVRGT
jgi:hypothetical protein